MNTTGLTYVTLKEKQVKLRFGLPACQEFYLMCLADDSEKYVNGTKLTALGIGKLLFAAYENACIVDDLTPELTRGNFTEWVEDMTIDNPAELERVVEVFCDSKYTTKLAEQATEVNRVAEEAKKKLIGISSKVLPSSNSGLRKSNTTPVPSESSSFAKKGTNVQKKKKQRPKK